MMLLYRPLLLSLTGIADLGEMPLISLAGNPWVVAIVLNSLLGLVAWVSPKKLLTPAGILHGWFLGVLVWGSLGWQGYGVVMFYFLFGSAVTKLGIAQKEAAGIAEKRSGARGPENVWGSAATAALCGIAILVLNFLGHSDSHAGLIALFTLAYVASFSTKLSDTCASEVGKAYGQRTFLITTLKPVPRGTEGAVSLEGTLAGIAASVVIAVLAWAIGMISPLGIGWCVLAALVATTVESLIGATLQNQWNWLTNEWVNVVNTAIGAIGAVGLAVGTGWY